jgi:alkaline phosphatase D
LNGRKVRSALVSAIAVATLALPATAVGAGFSFGVAAGDVTSSSAILWAHADASGPVTLRVIRAGRVVQRHNATAAVPEDNTVRVRVRHLRPSTRYRYQFFMGPASSEIGTFSTAPPPSRRRTIRFAYSGDADGIPAPGTDQPFYNHFEVYARMQAERNLFNVNLGDTIYSDSEVTGAPLALTLADKWAKYRQNLAFPNLVELRPSATLYSHWDDHEFRNDFSPFEFGGEIYKAGAQAFLDYAPVGYSGRTGLYRHFRWGRNLEIFLLDERTFRSAKASAGPACDNPFGRISDDLAPTAPQRLRNAFGFAIPPLKNPVPKACLDLIADPSRTFLGRAQLQRFERDIKRSRATFKIVLNETPIQQFYALPYDRWEGYAAERTKLLRFLKRNVDNVVFLTTDVHAVMVNDVRFQTLEPGGPKPSGMLEVTTGPAATKTFAREIDEEVGISGAGATVGRQFFKPPPPAGAGMHCVNLDVYSYAEVEVSARRVTVTPKDSAGKLVREPSGAACGPFHVRAKR